MPQRARVARIAVPIFLLSAPAGARETRQLTAVRVGPGAIQVDGSLDDPGWAGVAFTAGFLQKRPVDGAAPSQPTEVAVAFDDTAVIVGVRLTQPPETIRAGLTRRDTFKDLDAVAVSLDTYGDHRTAYTFGVTAGGTRFDHYHAGDDETVIDPSFDPVWEAATARGPTGWTAELRIPFSQLVALPQVPQRWGINVTRWIAATGEQVYWQLIPSDATGWSSGFGSLVGIDGALLHRRLELLPFVAADATLGARRAVGFRLGADLKAPVGRSATLQATVLPDFGQVEADPAVLNLTTIETIFDEKRPFFVEGAGYFGLGGFSCFFCSNVSSLSMLATRRIGRPPQISPFRSGLATPVEFADMPENSTILGAAKLTGRTSGGWSIGALDAVTKRERAPVEFTDTSRGAFEVEPATNYFAGRVARDLAGGATQIKAMATSVYRDLGDPYLQSRLSHHSEAFGVSSDSWWGKRTYRLMAQLAATHVEGDTAAMRRIRFGSAHFFQRPDRPDTADARAPVTGMAGLGGFARISKEQGHWLWEVMTNFRSPAFNNNDIAFFSRADYWWMSANIFPLWTKPTKWYRQLFVIAGGQQQYTFDGDVNDREGRLYGQIQTLSYWNISSFWIHRASVFDDRLTRGGPLVRLPANDFYSVNVNTDSRKKIVGQFNASHNCDAEGQCGNSVSLGLELRPRSNVTVSFNPGIDHSQTGYQFVGSYADQTASNFYGNRYVFAHLEQNAISMDTRFNVTFSPTLTLELFMQPLIASGAFSHYNVFAAPRGARRIEYGKDFGTVTTSASGITVDADTLGGGAPSYTFPDPTFTFRSLRGNAVLRWEYHPGSTLFLVWTRSSQIPTLARGNIQFGDDVSALFQGPSENIFLLKATYWLGF